ncbi:MAG: MFS transporter [Candidatus Hydrogenedentes bacterium]|nr:MFS transporter [Candidatus Hydrogenedentota bacterium]
MHTFNSKEGAKISFLKELKRVLSGNLLFLGITSLFTDASSEMVYPLLPIFIGSLVPPGSAPYYIGLMEGIAESTASLLKLVSGYVSDKIKKRKILTVSGYFISTICRLLIAFAQTGGQVVLFRFLDRVGKGIRTAPRDALLSDSTPSEHRGLAFSFHRLMDHSGAVLGPILSMVFLYILLQEKFIPYVETTPQKLNLQALRIMFMISFIPGIIAVLILALFVKEKMSLTQGVALENSETPKSHHKLPIGFYLFLVSVGIFSLGNSSDLFLVFYGNELFQYGPIGIVTAWITLHISKILFSLPGGRLSDRLGRYKIIMLGWGVYTLVYFGMSQASNQMLFWTLIVIYGAYYGFTEGVEKALIADLTPPESRGFAFGMYNLILGISALPASLIFGIFWGMLGAKWAFTLGAFLSASAMIILTLSLPRIRNSLLTSASLK